MGKKDKKKKSKDPEKKAELQAKKEAKAEKAARKRFDKEVRKNQQSQGDDDENDGDVLVRDDGNHDDEDDLDALLSSYAKKDRELTTPIIQTLGEGSSSTSPFPSPRANFSMTLLPNNDLLMFGGEYYDGAENIVYDDLYQWNPDAKKESEDEDDAGPQKLIRNHGGATTTSSEDENDEHDNDGTTTASEGGDESDDEKTAATNNNNHQHSTKSSMLPQSMSPSRSSALSSTNKGIWKQIISPHPRPNARCAHSAVLYRDCIYVFGGELATTDQFHHYRDFWCYNVKTRLWEELKPLGLGPSARSGHRCIVWRNYMILFGGFYEALRETPRWYNDLWVYNFATNTWKECKYSKLATIPDPRSGFVFGLNQSSPNADTAFLYGGFSKVKNPGDLSEGKVHTDTWALHLKPLLQQQQPSSQQDSSASAGNSTDGLPTWNRLTRKGDYPSPRVSVSGISHKHRLLLFGGVLDEEKDHHTVNSIFYDDLFHLDMEKRRWYALHLKTKPQPAPSEDTDGEIIEQQKKFRRRKKKSSTTPSSSSSPSSAAIHKSSHHRRATRHPARGAPPELKEEEEEDDTEQQQGVMGHGDDSKEKTKEKKNEKGGDKEQEDDDEEQDDGSGDDVHEEGDENAASSKGWDLEMLQTNMSSFVDGEGNVVYEKIKTRASTKHQHRGQRHDKQDAATNTTGGNHRRLVSDSTEAGYSTGYDADEGGFSSALEQSSVISMSAAEEIAAATGTVPSAASESVLKKPFITSLGGTSTTVNAGSGTSDAVLLAATVGSSTMSRRTAPLPRIKPALVVRGGNTLLVYGGLVEVGDREVTLDDVWTLDLSKRDKWNCIYEGTMSQQVWKGVTSDDEDSYVSGGAASGVTGNDLDDDDDEDDEDEDDDGSDEEDENEEVNEGEGAGDETKEEKARKKKEALREEMEHLKNEMSTKVYGNVERLPLPQESMADYYGRTKEMWIEVVKNAPITDSTIDKDEMSAKELKTASFAMARELYEEVVPAIERLEELQNKLHKHKKKKAKKTDEGEDDEKKQKRKKKTDKDHATAAVSAVPRDRRKNRAK